jgi:hypothetical protein
MRVDIIWNTGPYVPQAGFEPATYRIIRSLQLHSNHCATQATREWNVHFTIWFECFWGIVQCTLHIDYHWLIIYCFTSRSRIFRLSGDVTITGEGLQNLGLCSALRASKQGGIFTVSHLLWHWNSVFFQCHLKDRPIYSPITTQQGTWRIHSNPDPHGSLHIISNNRRKHEKAKNKVGHYIKILSLEKLLGLSRRLLDIVQMQTGQNYDIRSRMGHSLELSYFLRIWRFV